MNTAQPKRTYVKPTLEVFEYEVEHGFAGSMYVTIGPANVDAWMPFVQDGATNYSSGNSVFEENPFDFGWE